jgi:hypothetical protein
MYFYLLHNKQSANKKSITNYCNKYFKIRMDFLIINLHLWYSKLIVGIAAKICNKPGVFITPERNYQTLLFPWYRQESSGIGRL